MKSLAYFTPDTIKSWCYLLMAIGGALAAVKTVYEVAKVVILWIKAKIETELAKREAFNSLVQVAPTLLEIVGQFKGLQAEVIENTEITRAIQTSQIELQGKVERILNHEHRQIENVEKIAEQIKQVKNP